VSLFPPQLSQICQGLVNLVYFFQKTSFLFIDYEFFLCLFHQFWPLFFIISLLLLV
jgi:hypothetical protein